MPRAVSGRGIDPPVSDTADIRGAGHRSAPARTSNPPAPRRAARSPAARQDERRSRTRRRIRPRDRNSARPRAAWCRARWACPPIPESSGGCRSKRTHPGRSPQTTLERTAIPTTGIRSRGVCAQEELEQQCIRIGSSANGIVRKNELTEALLETRARGQPRGAETIGLRIGIGVERGFGESIVSGPEAGAADFMRVRLLCNRIRQARHSARMQRRRTPRKAGRGKIEAPPEKMDRTRLAEKSAAEE